MNRKREFVARYINILFVWLLLFSPISCDLTPYNPKELIANRIASESCSVISNFTSSFFIEILRNSLNITNNDDFINNTDQKTNFIPEYCCECYTFYMSQDLATHFTLSELNELVDDRIKLTIALAKIFSKNKNSIAICIESITQKKFQDYEEFESSLDKKLNSNSEF